MLNTAFQPLANVQLYFIKLLFILHFIHVEVYFYWLPVILHLFDYLQGVYFTCAVVGSPDRRPTPVTPTEGFSAHLMHSATHL